MSAINKPPPKSTPVVHTDIIYTRHIHVSTLNFLLTNWRYYCGSSINEPPPLAPEFVGPRNRKSKDARSRMIEDDLTNNGDSKRSRCVFFARARLKGKKIFARMAYRTPGTFVRTTEHGSSDNAEEGKPREHGDWRMTATDDNLISFARAHGEVISWPFHEPRWQSRGVLLVVRIRRNFIVYCGISAKGSSTLSGRMTASGSSTTGS